MKETPVRYMFQYFWPLNKNDWVPTKDLTCHVTYRCKYHKMIAEIFFYCLIFIFWSQTWMSSVYSKHKRSGLEVPVLSVGTVHTLRTERWERHLWLQTELRRHAWHLSECHFIPQHTFMHPDASNTSSHTCWYEEIFVEISFSLVITNIWIWI